MHRVEERGDGINLLDILVGEVAGDSRDEVLTRLLALEADFVHALVLAQCHHVHVIKFNLRGFEKGGVCVNR